MGLGSFFKRGKKEEKTEESHIKISTDECDGCEKCVTACSNNVLMLVDGKSAVRDSLVCRSCRVCVAICPNDCITVS